ncbi:hypothetical protein [Hydrocarboniphaga sp.]|uniref:hypothetical protein n=1 Tax=Hydrocarboniphaga sp. TaxID=2033016 RepID=UPI002621A31C|nr:hypothetical protein [Hydrocarboniphaga sp.]
MAAAAVVLTPVFTLPGTTHVAAGAALRNRPSAVINLSGVPSGYTLSAAYLYWAYASISGETADGVHNKMLFKGLAPTSSQVTLKGTTVGNGADPCWSGGSVFVYRADATKAIQSFIDAVGSLPLSYQVTLPAGAAGDVSGASPWSSAVPPLAEGASLVVILASASETGTTLVYDKKLAGRTIPGGSLAYSMSLVPAGFSTLMTTIGADGQVGGGYNDSATGETTTVNGTLIAGPGSTRSDGHWNGADGHAMPQLWDTATQDVSSLNDGSGTMSVLENSPGDCLVPVADVLSVK